ncbi:MAG TPA: hypothetical protein VD902_07075 [Symbiobacteriaceae bacterium]|nr:hypothetical protein [Symbiobacteriaceae bacterium]
MDKSIGRVRQMIGTVLLVLLVSAVMASTASAASNQGNKNKCANKVCGKNIYFED